MMRFSSIVMIAGALTAATPALAQNAVYPEENADAALTNDVAAANDVSADANLAVTDTAAAPAPAPEEAAPAPAPARRSFPWGLLGLIGLVGLLGRRNRTG